MKFVFGFAVFPFLAFRNEIFSEETFYAFDFDMENEIFSKEIISSSIILWIMEVLEMAKYMTVKTH